MHKKTHENKKMAAPGGCGGLAPHKNSKHAVALITCKMELPHTVIAEIAKHGCLNELRETSKGARDAIAPFIMSARWKFHNIAVTDDDWGHAAPNLTSLEIPGGTHLMCEAPPFSQLTGLTRLNIGSTTWWRVSHDHLVNLISLSLTRLQELNIRNMNITSVAPLARLSSLKKLDISYNESIRNVAQLTQLEELTAGHMIKTGFISTIAGLTKLTRLDLMSTLIVSLTPLTGLTGLRSLDLSRVRYIERPEDAELRVVLGALTKLTNLDVSHMIPRLLQATPFPQLTSLKSLSLEGDELTGPSTLERLSIRKCDNTGIVASVASFTRLTDLTLTFLTHPVVDWFPIAALSGLTRLRVSRCALDLAAIAPLTNLETLCLKRTRSPDMGPLAGLTRLRHLDLRLTMTHVGTQALIGLTRLTHLDISSSWCQAEHSALTALTALAPIHHGHSDSDSD